MSDIRDVLKNNLISYSKSKKISQKELSDRLGVTQSAVSHWFKGDNSPNIEIVAKIADILSVPISALLSESEINLNLEARGTPSVAEAIPKDVLAIIEQQYGSDAHKAFSMYVQLDQDDRGEIRGEMKQMLKADKYKKSLLAQC